MTPANSTNVYSFCRKNIPGSKGRFYCCDVRTMISSNGKSAGGLARAIRAPEMALVQTVQQNLAKFTKREIEQAGKARELIARMGFPSVGSAISMIERGTNFGVTEKDFRVADSIWGKDVASIKGKTKMERMTL